MTTLKKKKIIMITWTNKQTACFIWNWSVSTCLDDGDDADDDHNNQ